ncbi:MAG: hypothetical protein JWR72_3651 [Flavisolibacter sp.]|jgi:hypothetical protein|nr:hypothetical protein [Flavisolibacter sp.]
MEKAFLLYRANLQRTEMNLAQFYLLIRSAILLSLHCRLLTRTSLHFNTTSNLYLTYETTFKFH